MPFNLFGKKKAAAPKPKTSDTIQNLKGQISQFEKKEVHLQKQIDKCLEQAKLKKKKGDKRGALYQLKRKKMLDKQLAGIEGKKLNLEQQIFALDDAINNAEMIKAMGSANKAMKQEMKQVDIDDVDDLMADMQDQQDQLDEVNELMSNPMGDMGMDDDDIMDELDALEDEILAEDDEDLGLAMDLPEAGKGEIVKPAPVEEKKEEAKSKEDQELAELDALLM